VQAVEETVVPKELGKGISSGKDIKLVAAVTNLKSHFKGRK
jgi:uncharacterized protein YoaH (UPF0181 family)